MPDAKKIRQSLAAHSIPDSVINGIMEGHEAIPDNAPKEVKAPFLVRVIGRLNEDLDPETARAVMDWCACCKGGDREKNVRKFAGENRGKRLSEKIPALWSVPYMGNPVLNDDGTIESGISWNEKGAYRCSCSNFNGAKYSGPVPITYCYCCAGHFRHHYQIALGVRLKTKAVLSSALESQGRRPCRFVYEIVEQQ